MSRKTTEETGDDCWAAAPQRLDLSGAAIERIQELVANPPQPGARLREAARRFRVERLLARVLSLPGNVAVLKALGKR